MSAWSDFWHQVWSPAWAAGLAQGLLTTGLGLAGAYVFLYRQFRHDRVLAVEQAQAEVRAKAADEAGVHFVRAAASLDQIAFHLTGALRDSPPWEEDIRSAEALTWRVVKEPPPEQLDLAHADANALWRLLGARLPLVTYEDRDFDYAVEIEFTPFVVKLRQVGEAYRRWNGYGLVDLPSFAEYPFVLPDHADDADGSAVVQRMVDAEPLLLARFDATLERLRRRSLRSVEEPVEHPSE